MNKITKIEKKMTTFSTNPSLEYSIKESSIKFLWLTEKRYFGLWWRVIGIDFTSTYLYQNSKEK